MKIIWTFRALIWLIFVFMLFLVLNLLGMSKESFGWGFFIYGVLAYLIFYELPFFFSKRLSIDKKRLIFYYQMPPFFFVGTLIIDLIGNMGGYFFTTNWYDRFVHFTFYSWTTASVGFCYALLVTGRQKSLKFFAPYLAFLFSLSIQVIHEFVELAIDTITGTNLGTAATDVSDTARDLLFGTIGSIIYILVFMAWKKRKKIE